MQPSEQIARHRQKVANHMHAHEQQPAESLAYRTALPVFSPVNHVHALDGSTMVTEGG